MTKGASAHELRALLREQLAARLAPLGWQPADAPGGRDIRLAAFARPLDGDVAATAEIDMAVAWPDRPPVILTRVTVGVAYEPLRRLWPLLGDSVRRPTLTDDACDEDDDWSLAVARRDDVPAAVETLAALVHDHAGAFAERHGSLDALLAAHGAGDPQRMHLMVPALLAAAHRFAEAQDALAVHPGVRSRDEQRFVRRLRRFIDSGGDASSIPEEPPPRPERPARPSFTQLRRDAAAEQEALEAVRRRAGGRPRDEQRAMLEAELTRRGIARRPLWIERALDQRRTQPLEAVRSVGRLGRGVVRALRGDVPDLSGPDWLEPPVRAGYVYARYDMAGDAWIAVSLDTAASDWLRRAYAAVPKIGASADLDAWLDTDLAVHLGDRRVGTIEDPRGEALVALAAQRDEVPCVRACLTPRPEPQGYLLEVALPPTGG